MRIKSFITGCSGPRLSFEEKQFFRAENPWGYILFARNIESPQQVRELTAEFRDCAGRDNVPVLIDQEGGRVQRLRPPHWRDYPPGRALGRLFEADPMVGRRAAWLQSRLIALDLYELGINIDCLPVLDVPVAGAHDVIGDRAYSFDPREVAAVARSACDGLLAGGILPVLKHIPGHGRAFSDSHLQLPVVETSASELQRTDFVPFVELADMPLAMTAHVVYTAYDAENPATLSSTVIGDVIRGLIGFDGLLMSDDLSMKALSGDFAARTQSAFAAGCDLVLHCNGDMAEMSAIADASPEIAGEVAGRCDAALARLSPPQDCDSSELRAEFGGLTNVIV